MANRSRLQISKQDIVAYFKKEAELGTAVFKQKELAAILTKQRDYWRLAQRTNSKEFVSFLIDHANLISVSLDFPARTETLFCWGPAPLLAVISKIKKESYFTHYTAMRINGLTEQLPKSIYINYEKSTKNINSDLNQSAIDQAFSSPARISNNFADFHNTRVFLLNGQHTGRIGVIKSRVGYDSTEKSLVHHTNLERTLIDAVVSPSYCGGISEVAKAFELAAERISVNSLIAMLKKMDFTYPYHQAIGFYLERAGYKPKLLDIVRSIPMHHNFYLAHDMGQTQYIKEWKLFAPQAF